MTVAELIEVLQQYDDESPVFIAREHDFVELDVVSEMISCGGSGCPVVVLA